MSDQEIIDAIDAEIEGAEAASKSGSEEFYFWFISRIAGLNFARELIVKRMEASK